MSRGPRPGNLPNRVLLVTGRLAEPALRRVLSGLDVPFQCEVVVLGITVAALMTTEWIARHLEVPEGVDLVLIPGLCEGDPRRVSEKVGVAVEKGPRQLHELPAYFGREAVSDYGAWDIEIAAEINNAPRLDPKAIRRAAQSFVDAGADIIDIGCTPGLEFPSIGAVVRDLRAHRMRVSVDSFVPDEILAAVEAGAELVLSVNGSNIAVARDLAGSGARVVVVPDPGGTLDSIEPSVEKLVSWGVGFLIDPVLEPIGHGFMASLERYAEVRRRYPETEILMGIGNLTELTAADSTGVNAILIAVCQELGVRTVLTTEVIPWARGSVREIDIARRLMHHAVTRRTIPKHVDDRLVTIKDPEVHAFTPDEIDELRAAVTDSNFRIFADRGGITVFNNERIVRGTNIQEIFSRLGVDDPSHAFYLGKELARASLAVTLGKTYRQEGALRWGYLTGPDDANAEHVRLTAPGRAPGDGTSGQEPPSRDPALEPGAE
jgi:dihydropteroate synthase